jgi:hypothetical protein
MGNQKINTYSKFCPNVFVAKCYEKHEKGETIVLTTKYGQEHENEVHNFLGTTKDGFFLYSITRLDGFNSQQRAINKAEKLEGYANNAEQRSTLYYEASQEGREFLSLGEPIKIGHHSERRHRKLIERNWERMGKSVSEGEKAKEYERRAEYWKNKANKIDLSMPDSLEYFEFKLHQAKQNHKFLKDNPDKRPHSMSLQYANKEIKTIEENLNLAVKLWGDDETIQQTENEKKEKAEQKASKGDKMNSIIKKYGGFFAFNETQFKEGYSKTKEALNLEEGEKVTSFGMGLYIPSRFKDDFAKEYKKY